MTYDELEKKIIELEKEIDEKNEIIFQSDIRHKSIEDVLRESEEKIRSIVECSPFIIFLVDKQMRIQFINRVPAKITIEQALGTSCLDYVHPDYRTTVETAIRKVFETGEFSSFTIQARGKNDTLAWYSTRLTPVKKGTKIDQVVLITEDITERKIAENEREKLNKELKLIIAAATTAIMDKVDFNETARLIFNMACETTQAKSGYIALLSANGEENELLFLESGGLTCSVDTSLPMPVRGLRGEAYRSGKAVLENDFMNSLWVKFMPKGHVNLKNVMFIPLNIDGKTVGIMGLANKPSDFTEDDQRLGLAFGQKTAIALKNSRNMKALMESKKQLAQAQKMESVGRLAGGVAHDFNNMLGVILGNIEMALEEVPPNQPLHDNLKEIEKAASRSADLARQLLAFARKQTISPKVIDLNETVEGMLKMLRRLIGENIDMSWNPGVGLWPVKMDPAQLDQILANLCINAKDAIDGVGNIAIHTENTTLDDAYCDKHQGFLPGDYVLLSVSDTGCGMNEETKSQIFEPFYTTKKIGKGTGLGLATVYGAVKQNNGFINVISELGRGTCFNIYLPRYSAKLTHKAEECGTQSMAKGKETILLVEDEPAILKMTQRMLEMMGYAVLPASTPGEAIQIAKEYSGHIDIVMTDVIMPEMNGKDLAKNLMSLYPDIKRLFMSGYTADVIAHHGVIDHGVHFIQKPFSKNDLAKKLREAIGHQY
ncbi:MAG: response regulator [Desulfobacterales bacterium]|nr:response regulator [Desulfobacterales bacterium]